MSWRRREEGGTAAAKDECCGRVNERAGVVPCINGPRQFQGRGGGNTTGVRAAQQSSGQPAVWTCVRHSRKEPLGAEEVRRNRAKLKVTVAWNRVARAREQPINACAGAQNKRPIHVGNRSIEASCISAARLAAASCTLIWAPCLCA